jgi:hypothetical protein
MGTNGRIPGQARLSLSLLPLVSFSAGPVAASDRVAAASTPVYTVLIAD